MAIKERNLNNDGIDIYAQDIGEEEGKRIKDNIEKANKEVKEYQESHKREYKYNQKEKSYNIPVNDLRFKSNTPILIADSVPGSGKSSSAINFINNTPEHVKIIYVTPYLEEVERIKENCKGKKFISPEIKKGKKGRNKTEDFEKLIKQSKNIVCTHKLFSLFTPECINIAKFNNYILIMDEVANVVEKLNINKDDLNDILNVSKYAHVDEKTHMVVWDDLKYKGVFNSIKIKSLMGCIFLYGDKENPTAFLWSFPISIFNAFSRVYILTYLFKGQIQAYYFDYFGVQYKYIHIKYKGEEVRKILPNDIEIDKFSFSDNAYDEPQQVDISYYKDRIKILENKKMNEIGEYKNEIGKKRENKLSSSWYKRNENSENIETLKKNCRNYFINICPKINNKSNNINYNMWTTYKKYQNQISGMGYAKSFTSCNLRATNLYKDKYNLAYLINVFLNPIVNNFFQQKGIRVNQDVYALSEVIQWLFRSRLRLGEEVNLYLPSERMRRILEGWGEIEYQEDKTSDEDIDMLYEAYKSSMMQNLIDGTEIEEDE